MFMNPYMVLKKTLDPTTFEIVNEIELIQILQKLQRMKNISNKFGYLSPISFSQIIKNGMYFIF